MTDLDKVARAICREQCAVHGEPPCWHVDAGWPNRDCDEPGCHTLAAAALAALAAPPEGEKGEE